MSEPTHGHQGHRTARRRSGAHNGRSSAPGAAPDHADGAAPGSGSQQAPGGRAAARRAARGGGKRRGRRALKIAGLAMGFVLLATGGAAAYTYWKLNSNIKSDDLSANGKDGAGHEKPDAFGRTPINILVIGSDGRTSTKDCKLGGACKQAGGQRADVEMVVHISADRSNATVMSVPRDLRANWSGCHDDGHQAMGPQHNTMINAALAGGPGCSVVAVHELTGIPIDHFMMVDFSGVVDMSNAVGGVRVCVDADVYDPYSHLKLKKGSHVLQGTAALEFLRTRHGFGDSSDSRGRTGGQHVFLTALLNKLKDDGTLTSPTKLWKVANAATKLTVDKSLRPIARLIGLGTDLNKVPTSRVRFVTLQTADTKVNGVWQTHLVQPGASALFRTIADDQSLTTASGGESTASPSAPTSATPTVQPTSIAVQVRNGAAVDGRLVGKRATVVAGALIDRGFSKQTSAVTGTATATTSLTYPVGQSPQAQAVAQALGIPAKDLRQSASATGIVLVVGSDWASGATFPGAKTDASDAQRTSALDGTNSQLGSDKGTCAKVSKFDDVIGVDANGRVTTAENPPHSTSPTHAYAISSNVKDSAP
ncbi:LCP family protein [Actinacidiphila rubida]|uniref:LCP family protein n=1 Tax=Actinacidiphila rubida TaxID=310780 RepID=UPI001FEC4092|nr:LCP family protein [Actinacidiphila rubida]